MKEDILIQFGHHMRLLRKKRNMTQEQLAGGSHISLKYVQRIEGKNPPNLSLEKLKNLADAFEIPLWKLVKF